MFAPSVVSNHRHQTLPVSCAGLSGYASQVTMTMALRRAKAAPATAMSYLSVIWCAIVCA